MANTISELASVYTYKREVERASSTGSPSAGRPAEKADTSEKSQAVPSSERLTEQIQSLPETVRRNLEFSVDDATGQQVVKIVDSDSGKLVRQIPSEQMMRIISQAQEFMDKMQVGVFLDDKS